MSAPRFADCRCGHGQPAHAREGMAPQCTERACTCIRYRPAVPSARPTAPPPGLRSSAPATVTPIAEKRMPEPEHPTPPPPAAPAQGAPAPDRLVAAGKRSTDLKVRRLAERLEGLMSELLEALLAERARTEALERVRVLEQQLAEARSAAGLDNTAPDCPECGRSCRNAAGLGIHRRKAHGVRGVA